MPKMTGGQYIAESFKGYGVTHAFLVPAILRKTLVEMDKRGIRPIVTHGEKAAAYMADGYARASHRIGVCMAQSVGAANLAAGLQDAKLALSPVMAITGHRPASHKGKHSYQEIEHPPLYAPVTKFCSNVETLEQLPFLMRRAFREATSGAPGPVHLDLAGIAGEVIGDAEADLELIIEEQYASYPPSRPEPELARVREAALAINRAQRPIIVAGGGVTASGAKEEVRALAETLSIPVAYSLNAKNTLPDDHPLSVGVVGSYSRWCANMAVSEADLVVYIGSRTSSQVTHDWRIPRPGTAVVQIDIDPTEIGRHYPAQVGIVGDAKVTLQRLLEVVDSAPDRSEWVEQVQGHVRDWHVEVQPFKDSDDEPIRPERLCKELSGILPSDALVASDTGHSGIWTGTMLDMTHPDQSYIRCAGTLGWSLSAAMGAKCAAPDRPAICFTGDGGFWYHIAELETAARYGINAVFVVNNNSALSQDRAGDFRAYEGEQGDPTRLFKFQEIDFAHLAETVGCKGIRVQHPRDIPSAIEEALASNRPTVVDVVGEMNVAAAGPWG